MNKRKRSTRDPQKRIATATLQDVLTTLMEECDIDDAKLSRKIDIPASTIARIRTNPNANPTTATLRPIAKFFEISIDQLIGDTPLPENRLPGTHSLSPFTTARVPVIEWSSLSEWQQEENNANKPLDWISTEKEVGEKTFSVIVPSNSLGLAFQKGSILIIDPERSLQDGDFALFNANNEISLKQILKDGKEFYIKSANPEIKGIKLLQQQYTLLGVIIETRFSYQGKVEPKYIKETPYALKSSLRTQKA